MIEMTYIIGDVREPILENNQKGLIIHCCNDLPAMGSGVAKALYEKWPIVKSEYMKWGNSKVNFALGNIQGLQVETDIAVINMIGQRHIKPIDGIPPIRYGAMRQCIQKVAKIAIKYSASVHIPYLMGSDLAGGEWKEIEKIIIEELCQKEIKVIIYDLFNKRAQKIEEETLVG